MGQGDADVAYEQSGWSGGSVALMDRRTLCPKRCEAVYGEEARYAVRMATLTQEVAPTCEPTVFGLHKNSKLLLIHGKLQTTP